MYRIWAAIGLLLLAFAVVPGSEVAAPGGVAPSTDVAQPGLLPAPPSPTVAPGYRDAVYGDFLQAGNSVLRCPVGEEVSGDHSPAECAAATAASGPSDSALLDNSGNNNGYYMHLADDDGRPDSFTSSRAEITIPAGATVRHAQLNWGGHTGTFIGFSGVNCVRPLLLQGEPPPPPAAASPAQQQVRIAVAGGTPVPVRRDPAHFRTTDGLTEPSQLYSDWADVTRAFAGAPTGTPIPLSVSNVWAPTGPGCSGGWSVVVVFGYDEPRAPYTQPRVIDLYTDDLPKSGALLPGLIEPLVPGFPTLVDGLLPGLVPGLTGTSVVLPGVARNRSTADVAIGLTAYDGDWRQGGETFTVDGAAAVEPCGGRKTEDFFRSCAVGAVDPVDPAKRPVNNLSVDAKTIRPTLADNDSGEVEIGVAGIGDFVVVHNVVLAETVAPSISVVNTGPTEPVTQGELATFTVDVRNDGALPLTGVTLTDTSDPTSEEIRCTPTALPPLAPGATTRVTCLQPAGAGPRFTNTATATGTYLVGPGGERRTVSASASAEVQVELPDYAITRVPDRLVVREGDPVVFAVTLTNNTTAPLTGIAYADGAAPDCAGPTGTTLAAGTSTSFTCTATAPAESFESAGRLTGLDATGATVTITSQQVLVTVIAPAATITTAVDKDTVYRGDSVELTFTVTNTGDEADEALSDLRVAVADLPDCAPDPIPSLAPGATAETTCTTTPSESLEVVAALTAVDVGGAGVTATAEPVAVTVLDPLITLTQQVDRTPVRVTEGVTLTFAVTSTATAAEGPVTDVRITSPTLPPDCLPEPIPTLAPGETATRTCTAVPDRSFDNQALASAVDGGNRLMRTQAAPLRVTVINPALTISTTADREQAKHGEDVDFTVTVRNIGDVPVVVEVGNDRAPDCDFTLTGEGLRAGAANGIRCTTTTPTDDATTELKNTATYTASPTPAVGDTGEPLTGADDATVTLLAGDAPPPPTPGPDPVGGDGISGGTAGGPTPGTSGGGSTGGSTSDAAGRKSDGGLASTGADIALPLGIGVALLLVGGGVLAATSRRREDGTSPLSRWWPGG
ncbi:DUF7507 domain-containing protein [Actinokineospora spheciospongiae]|uniref:DUF7507 domain-containing protein n=1 Tax=Actinokineospora spheciospongiae TaxID=909613 RepID=UPI000D71AA29|nr:hypothetical protein [Actinokineospora spheciospongiae]PWW66536.1 putative repeat protein (TIGR01451 family) [Actinokineospora spheciospongiae]